MFIINLLDSIINIISEPKSPYQRTQDLTSVRMPIHHMTYPQRCFRQTIRRHYYACQPPIVSVILGRQLHVHYRNLTLNT
jgi:hypothetical protein